MFPEKMASWKTREDIVSKRDRQFSATKKSTKIKTKKYSLNVTRR